MIGATFVALRHTDPARSAARLLALIALVALGLSHGISAPSVRQLPASTVPDAGPRVRVGGLLAYQMRSEVQFVLPEGAPEVPAHRLIVTEAFPDRARWQLEPLADRTGGRRVVYLFGSALWMLAADEARSQRLTGDDAEALRTAFSLRRAAMLWPDGFEWSGEGEQRTAALPSERTLTAWLGPEGGPPTAIESRLADGTVLERFDTIEWTTTAGRTRPTRFDFHVSGEPVWRERVLEFDPNARHVDAFFQPHDARTPGRTNNTSALPNVMLVETPRRAVLRVELTAPVDWPAARAEFDAQRRGVLERVAPLEIEDVLRAEVDSGGRPTALLLALTGEVPDVLPTGFRLEPAGSALTVLAGGTEEIDAALLARLESARPADTVRAGAARVRLRPSADSGPRVQVSLPLAPGEPEPR